MAVLTWSPRRTGCCFQFWTREHQIVIKMYTFKIWVFIFLLWDSGDTFPLQLTHHLFFHQNQVLQYGAEQPKCGKPTSLVPTSAPLWPVSQLFNVFHSQTGVLTCFSTSCTSSSVFPGLLDLTASFTGPVIGWSRLHRELRKSGAENHPLLASSCFVDIIFKHSCWWLDWMKDCGY